MPASLLLPDHIYSREQLLRLDEELARLENDQRDQLARQKVGHTKTKLVTRLSPEFAEVVDQLIGKELSQSAVKQARQTLSTNLEKYQSVHIILAHPPPTSELESLVHWFRTQVSAQIFLEITINPTIVGGMIVRAGSKLYDFSFLKALDAGKPALGKVVRGV